jgi:hypothetical protein
MDSRWFAGFALAAGAYVVWSELTYRGASTLTPILLALGAGLAVGVGPQLADRPDQTRGPIGDDEERAAQTAPDERLAEVEPVLDPGAKEQIVPFGPAKPVTCRGIMPCGQHGPDARLTAEGATECLPATAASRRSRAAVTTRPHSAASLPSGGPRSTAQGPSRERGPGCRRVGSG